MRIDKRAMRRVAQGWLSIVVLGFVTILYLSTHAALRAMAAHRETQASADVVPAGYEADDHFPGAASLLADSGSASASATGTAPLPSLPVSERVAEALVRAEPAGIVAALPFNASRIGAVDRGRALECLTAAIYYEAGSEPIAGQQAVAQVVLNRVRHPAFPATVCGVVYQGSEKIGCQFSFACDGAMARARSAAGWARAGRVAAAALAGWVYAPVGLATHYHTYAVTPAWNRQLVMTDMVGAHLFHRWKGYWGTATAFRQHYVGGEPMPGPHVPVLLPNDIALSPTLSGNAVNGITVSSEFAPKRIAETPDASPNRTTPSPKPSERDRLPPAPAILATWKDAGTPR